MRIWLLFLLVMGLSACAGSDNVQPPTPLQKLDHSIPVKRLWRTDTGEGNGKYYLRLHPLIAADKVYVVSATGQLGAFRLQDGGRIWSQKLEQRITAGVDGNADLLLVGAEDGRLTGLSPNAGELRWQQSLSSTVTAVSNVLDGRVVARTGDGYIYALSVESGKIVWKLNRPVPTLSLQGQGQPILARGAAIVGLDNGRVLLLSLKTGAVGWEKTVASPRGRSELERMVDIDGRMALDGSTLYVVTYNGQVAAIDARSGNLIWKREASSVTGVTLAPNALVFSDDEGVVWKLDRRTGIPIWKQDSLKFRRLTRPALLENYAVVADFEGYLHWLDIDTGKLVARGRADHAGVLSPPQVVDKRVIVLGQSGELSAWSLE